MLLEVRIANNPQEDLVMGRGQGERLLDAGDTPLLSECWVMGKWVYSVWEKFVHFSVFMKHFMFIKY